VVQWMWGGAMDVGRCNGCIASGNASHCGGALTPRCKWVKALGSLAPAYQ